MKRAVFVAALLALAGCSYHRQVTPWLRTEQHRPFCLMAESGGGCRTSISVERRLDGAWVEVPDGVDAAFAFAGDERAVLGDRILSEHGPDRPLRCPGELRGLPDGSALLCVTVDEMPADTSPAQVALTRIDRDGETGPTRRVALPIVLARRPIEGPDVDTNFLGFDEAGLVFSVFVSRQEESFANGTPKHADAYRLLADDRWQRIGALDFRAPEFWVLHFPRRWNENNGWHIDRGRYARDSAGEPNP